MIKFKVAFVSLLMAVAGCVGLAGTPAAATALAPGCTTFGFCLHDTATSNPFTIYSGSFPRNTCDPLDPEDQNIASFATENTGVQWWLFRTTSCGGSHIAVHANTNLNLATGAPAGWNNAVVAVMRTSTVG
jgi:ABC-type glycerol-3-phosphate transport system substrate-binding protein